VLAAILSIGAIGALLVTAEYLWRKKLLDAEIARKLIHIGVGTFIAFWPLFMSWTMIQLLAGVLFLGVLVSYQFGVFGAIHKVKRKTGGELWFPVGIGLAALLTDQPWVFAVAVMHLSLADGLAAVVGSKWARKHYQIGQHTRSLLGSFAFFVVSAGLCAGAFLILSRELPGISLAVFAITPFLATAVESISRHGLDNVFVPLVVVFALGLPTGTILINL